MEHVYVPWLQEMLDKAEKNRLETLERWRREEKERTERRRERLSEIHKSVHGNDYY